MATATTAKTTTPRTRASRAKAAPAKVEAAAEETPTVEKFTVELLQLDDTKSYSVFTFPQGCGCVGKVYVPHGAKTVKVLVVGGEDE